MRKSRKNDPDELNSERQSEELKESLKDILSNDSVIIDVGSNRGQFVSELLKSYEDIRVYCFEPGKEAYVALVEVTKHRPRIECHNVAISLETGKVQFYITKSSLGCSILMPRADQSSEWLTIERIETAESIRLDEFIEVNSVLKDDKNIDLLKIDAQGYDLEVLRSAGAYLHVSQIRAILMEVNFQAFYYGQHEFSEVLKALSNAGYRLAWLYQHRAYDSFLLWADALFLPKTRLST
jgi:FkbM family methyltransferase